MRKFIVFVLLFINGFFANAQLAWETSNLNPMYLPKNDFLSLSTRALANDSVALHQQFYRAQQQSLSLLSGWSVLNVAYSPLASQNLFNPTTTLEYFHLGNFNWSLLNIGIAGLSHYSVYRKSTQPWSISGLKTQKRKVKRTIKINIALDCMYIIAGALLKQAASVNSEDYQNFQGNGNSIILQGSFLLFYDSIFLRKVSRVQI
jgi:hypothetical protein